MLSISPDARDIQGRILTPEDPGYDAARTVFMGGVDRRPALIARPTDAADVARVIALARDSGAELAVRGGGHSPAGHSASDGGVVLDLRGLRAIDIDLASRTAWAGGGLTAGEYTAAAGEHGLATGFGDAGSVGVAGITLSGGVGFLVREHGMTIDQLLAAEIVTADGRVLEVDAERHPDLFWAIRGGGGNFGVVTRLRFRLHDVSAFTGGILVLPASADVLDGFLAEAEAAPDALSTIANVMGAPPMPFLPPEVHGKPAIVLASCYVGPVEQGAQAVEPLRHFGTPYGEHLGAMPFTAWQKGFDPLLTPGARNYWKSHNFAELSDDALAVLTRYTSTLPSPHCEIFIGAMAGQTNRVAVDATAYANRDSVYTMNVHGRWTEASDDDKCVAWARELFNAMTPFALGSVYVNFLTGDEGDRVKAAYGPNYARLAAVKSRYDPQNLFRSNQNIAPSA